MSKPGSRAVSPSLYKLSTRQLVFLTSIGRVCLQQCHEQNNWSFSILHQQRVSPKPHGGTECTSILHRGTTLHIRLGQPAYGVEMEHCESPGMLPEVCRSTSLTSTPVKNR